MHRFRVRKLIRNAIDSLRRSLSGREGRFARWQITVLASMYCGYAAFMVCRNTLIASSAQMIQDPSLGMDKESFGHLMSWHSAGAIMGKLVTGPGADVLGGRRMFLIALSLTAMANVGFAFSSSFFAFAVFNFFGQFAKAGGWSAMTKMVGSWYPESRYGQVWSIISTSSRIGSILAGLVLGYLLSLVDWRGVFLFSAVMTAGVVVGLFFYLKEQPEDVELPSLLQHSESQHRKSREGDRTVQAAPETSASPHPFDSLTLLQVCGRFFCSGRVWFICLSLVHLTIVMDFLTFIPIYLSETLDISASKASMAGSTFPAGMFTALVLTSFVYDRLSKKRLIFVIGGLLIASVTCVVALWNLNQVPADYRTPTAIVTIFLLGLTISPAYYIPMSVFSVTFGGKHSGFLVSLIDVFGYCGALVFNFFGGSIAQHYGWTVFLSGLVAITVLAGVYMVTFLTLDWRSSKQVE